MQEKSTPLPPQQDEKVLLQSWTTRLPNPRCSTHGGEVRSVHGKENGETRGVKNVLGILPVQRIKLQTEKVCPVLKHTFQLIYKKASMSETIEIEDWSLITCY